MKQVNMFENRRTEEPLAARLRPQTLDEYAGQKHLVGKGKILRRMIENDQISSMIFWGPPGVGKTTLARIIARQTRAEFLNFSAVTSGIREIRQVMKEAEQNQAFGGRTIVFVDEIHRFNKAQQDAFLPFVERGTITLIGATTENPSFEVNGALLSRCRVFMLKALTKSDVKEVLRRALYDPRGFGTDASGRNSRVRIDDSLLDQIAVFSNGDARSALSTLEMAVLNGQEKEDHSVTVTRETVEQCTGKKMLLYDRNGEEHYNLISALHKSMRNSDPDAAVYWLARMLEAGEDPLYVARRVVRFASEDVGMADPRALQTAVAAYQACHYIGMPECSVHLTQAVVYMSLAPKSNALYRAYEHAKTDALNSLAEPVPMNIRNGVTGLMREEGYGKGYQYAHDTKEKLTDMQCLPDDLEGTVYYDPTEQGLEKKYKERLQAIKEWKERKRKEQK
ncbi:MAG: replication-associated recombination protein A [Eubacterium sp.]|jgi:putative ATPase|nr:replication-associated recombination protein A [Eubacterium sp.]MCH4046605.1 replication-associated recombination protein A [Eubacterium sp.]MCH4079701.1 replication-associated recombination protein A [Eubacterium sp.]MCH4110261.1 replication-associated recombination protein A [Eubacterium sp.]MCI1308139.1 replication-associated recombination protein A [Eubacterium sp.]